MLITSFLNLGLFSPPPERTRVKREKLNKKLAEAGRYLAVFFVRKSTGDALIISAREMSKKERKAYASK